MGSPFFMVVCWFVGMRVKFSHRTGRSTKPEALDQSIRPHLLFELFVMDAGEKKDRETRDKNPSRLAGITIGRIDPRLHRMFEWRIPAGIDEPIRQIGTNAIWTGFDRFDNRRYQKST